MKEESQPVFERISALVGQPQIKRVYSAMRGRYFAYDLRLGVDGLVSGMSMYAEVFARMWAASREGDWDAVRDIHGKLLVMLTCETEIPRGGPLPPPATRHLHDEGSAGPRLLSFSGADRRDRAQSQGTRAVLDAGAVARGVGSGIISAHRPRVSVHRDLKGRARR